jgi:outer membrane protein OmpA-like peptidoglycan-associated protein
MTTGIRKIGITAAAVALGLVLAAPVSAQSLQDQITNALKPANPPPPPGGMTRGLTVQRPADPNSPDQQKFINSLRTRSISIEPTTPGAPSSAPSSAPPQAIVIAPEEKAKIVEIVASKPKIDLEIFFDYNSWVVGPKALPALIALGNVLSNPDFKGTVFFINGYTDARGSPEYNQVLSQHRADSVRRILIDQYHLSPDTLIAVGFGKEQLKIPDQPYADQNRRVQIVNTEMKGAAK